MKMPKPFVPTKTIVTSDDLVGFKPAWPNEMVAATDATATVAASPPAHTGVLDRLSSKERNVLAVGFVGVACALGLGGSLYLAAKGKWALAGLAAFVVTPLKVGASYVFAKSVIAPPEEEKA